jgi:hypothetical protein
MSAFGQARFVDLPQIALIFLSKNLPLKVKGLLTSIFVYDIIYSKK